MINYKLSFLSNNVKGNQASEKRLKLFEYFRKLNTPAGFVFLQETHSLVDFEKDGTKIFKVNCFFHIIKQTFVESPWTIMEKKVFQTSEKI